MAQSAGAEDGYSSQKSTVQASPGARGAARHNAMMRRADGRHAALCSSAPQITKVFSPSRMRYAFAAGEQFMPHASAVLLSLLARA